MDDVADLQKILSEKESEIATLQSLSTHDKETHELKVRVREPGSERSEFLVNLEFGKPSQRSYMSFPFVFRAML